MRFPGFFDEEFKLERISTLGDPLERLNGSKLGNLLGDSA